MVKHSNSKNWFEIIKQKEYLYIIRERLDEIDPRFYTFYINSFVIEGSHSALLIDTGSGLFPIKPIISDLILDKKLIVINTHSHFDHIGGNHEFNEVLIHKKERNEISKPHDISFFKNSSKEMAKLYEKLNYTLPPTNNIHSIKDGFTLDLGELSVKIIHTPGHSAGSICLLTSRNEFFSGDSAHYGTMYLYKKNFSIMLSNLSKLLDLFQETKIEIYPSHEEFAVGKELLIDLSKGIKNIDNIWDTKVRDEFLEAWILNDEIFKYVIF
ncbi:MAG: MBL fold metallo-hydrolase [Promethearchaeota archaeon]